MAYKSVHDEKSFCKKKKNEKSVNECQILWTLYIHVGLKLFWKTFIPLKKQKNKKNNSAYTLVTTWQRPSKHNMVTYDTDIFTEL